MTDQAGLSASCPITVVVRDVNEQHSIAPDNANVDMAENALVGTDMRIEGHTDRYCKYVKLWQRVAVSKEAAEKARRIVGEDSSLGSSLFQTRPPCNGPYELTHLNEHPSVHSPVAMALARIKLPMECVAKIASCISRSGHSVTLCSKPHTC